MGRKRARERQTLPKKALPTGGPTKNFCQWLFPESFSMKELWTLSNSEQSLDIRDCQSLRSQPEILGSLQERKGSCKGCGEEERDVEHPKDWVRGFGAYPQMNQEQTKSAWPSPLYPQLQGKASSPDCAKYKMKPRTSNLSVSQHLYKPQASLPGWGFYPADWLAAIRSLASVVASIFLCLLPTFSASNIGSSGASPSVPLCYLAYSWSSYFRIIFLSSLFKCICHLRVVISQERTEIHSVLVLRSWVASY